jgi:tripartite-type tricarboxylate transporter receptor subunit TctC
MSCTRRRILAAAGTLAVWPSLSAQPLWPARTVTLVIPFPAGGHTDVIGRLMAEQLSKRLQQGVVVENRPGVNGSLGTEAVSRAAPDGHTLMLGGVGTFALNPRIYPTVRYDALRDFTHISGVARSPNVLLAGPHLKEQTVREVIERARAQPRAINFALTGIGSSGQMAMELLRQSAGVEFNSVPYKGDAPATVDLMGGQVDLLFVNSVVAVPHVRAGKLRALAVTGSRRNPLLPDVPTLAESGWPQAVAESWNSLAGPRGLPEPVVTRLNREVQAILAQPEVRERLATSGTEAMGGEPAEIRRFMAEEVERWASVIQAAGIRLSS